MMIITQSLARSDFEAVIDESSLAVRVAMLIEDSEAISANVGFFYKGHGEAEKARPLASHVDPAICTLVIKRDLLKIN